jgi:hypothetical protein
MGAELLTVNDRPSTRHGKFLLKGTARAPSGLPQLRAVLSRRPRPDRATLGPPPDATRQRNCAFVRPVPRRLAVGLLLNLVGVAHHLGGRGEGAVCWVFPPTCPTGRGKAVVLQVGAGDTTHQRMLVQAGPRSSLEMTETEFLLQLLVRLFADPARLDGGGQRAVACLPAGCSNSTSARRLSAIRPPARLYRLVGANCWPTRLPRPPGYAPQRTGQRAHP